MWTYVCQYLLSYFWRPNNKKKQTNEQANQRTSIQTANTSKVRRKLFKYVSIRIATVFPLICKLK